MGDLAVFLREQEFQILDFILRLPALSLPLEVGAIGMLAILNELKVQIVVFFHDAFVLVLKWSH